ncbi:MAG: rhomboid family intramembrane serine protease [Spirochaetota bacterium]
MYAFPKITKAIKIILIIHAVGFLLSLFTDIMPYLFGLNIIGGDFFAFVSIIWQIFTYPIVGSTHIFSLLLFALFMWWVGSRLEEMMGTKVFLIFYLTTIAVGGLLSFIVLSIFTTTAIIGIVGITFAIIAVYAYLAPNLSFYIFGIFPIKVKYLLLISIIITLAGGQPYAILYRLILQIFTGLAAVSFMFVMFPLPTWLVQFQTAKDIKDKVEDIKQNISKKRKRNFTVYTNPKEQQKYYDKKNNQYEKDTSTDEEQRDEEWKKEEVDRLLDKISHYGVDALTKKEKKFLDEYGKDYKDNK